MTLTLIDVPAFSAEDVLVATHGPDEGAVFTGTDDGSIWRIRGAAVEKVADTGGRPLGIEMDGDGRLLVCDAALGLLRVDPATGGVETVTTSAGGRDFVFCNNAAIAGDGTVWFSDSSARFGIDQWKHEVVHATRTGRLIRLAPDGTTTVVRDGLSFANGVALSSDESFVVVAETVGRTVVRHWLDGRPDDHLVTDLPGYPDNVALGSDGLIWVTIASPTDPVVEMLHRAPWAIQSMALRIPEGLQPKAKRTVRVQAYDNAGTLVHDIDLKSPEFHMVTGVREHDGTVWLGSLEEPRVASFRLADL